MKKIITGANYSDDGQPQMYVVTEEKIIKTSGSEYIEMHYVETKTGYTGHVHVSADGTVHVPNIFAGHYYPTKYRVIEG